MSPTAHKLSTTTSTTSQLEKNQPTGNEANSYPTTSSKNSSPTSNKRRRIHPVDSHPEQIAIDLLSTEPTSTPSPANITSTTPSSESLQKQTIVLSDHDEVEIDDTPSNTVTNKTRRFSKRILAADDDDELI